jgi:energy-coupling factor transporter ATP-binding protein EcfA2
MGALYFITGSCGSGKSTLLAAVKAALPGLSAHHTDSMGVPSVQEMINRFGSTDAWQAHRLREWVERAAASPGVTVVDGQARPKLILDAVRDAGLTAARVVLVDCGHAERRTRLLDQRRQPELDVLDTYAWAAYLRGQADALGLEVIDTTGQAMEDSAALLDASITRFAAEAGIAIDSTQTM